MAIEVLIAYQINHKMKPISKEDLTPKEKFKKAAKEYGFVLVAFHVGISLMSLGSIYFFIINGFDVQQWISFIGMSNTDENTKIVAGASQFIIAYAIHKSLAPFRISITLVSVPLIVRYLRTKGFMKKKN
ncbi:protein FAM210B, mitochondrial-like [Daktulosphaira vitifoliae]|uniref:protein FAM210B, mitochondrial-like n=1 Tax=Daktulosphaira vitifoliae TaxID=58002 RepID=UPI0021A9E99B|nr:protein FAM210B, mitochondrial-like [Daktulosphaira vitifoliae]